MTGKDEWRLVHVNAAGQLVDSLIKKKEEEKKPNLNNLSRKRQRSAQPERTRKLRKTPRSAGVQ